MGLAPCKPQGLGGVTPTGKHERAEDLGSGKSTDGPHLSPCTQKAVLSLMPLASIPSETSLGIEKSEGQHENTHPSLYLFLHSAPQFKNGD